MKGIKVINDNNPCVTNANTRAYETSVMNFILLKNAYDSVCRIRIKNGSAKMDKKDIAVQTYLEGYDEGRTKTAREIFKQVYSYTAETEVGTRYLIRRLAMEYGIELPKQPRKGLNGFEK